MLHWKNGDSCFGPNLQSLACQEEAAAFQSYACGNWTDCDELDSLAQMMPGPCWGEESHKDLVPLNPCQKKDKRMKRANVQIRNFQ